MGHYLFARSVLTRERKVLPMTGPRRLIIKKPFQVRALFDAYFAVDTKKKSTNGALQVKQGSILL